MTRHTRRRMQPERHRTWDRILTVVAGLSFVTWALVSAFRDAHGQEITQPVAPDPGIALDARVQRIVDANTIDCTVLVPLV